MVEKFEQIGQKLFKTYVLIGYPDHIEIFKKWIAKTADESFSLKKRPIKHPENTLGTESMLF